MNLYLFVAIIALVCLLGFFNEKVTKLTYEISLMLFSIAVGALLLLGAVVFNGTDAGTVLKQTQLVNIERFLLEGVLCFMLFAGSCHMKLSDFKAQARQVTVLAFVCTLLGAVFYGALFFGASVLLGLNISLPVCLMFGSIIAPTDPIAATSILSKFGLPKNISFLIQGESLFNDGVGVALFVCFSGMATATSSGGFFAVMLKEILGAVLVGAAATGLCFLMFRFTKNKTLGIFISLLSVSLSYAVCEACGFSGAIASVVCGIMFSALRSRFSNEENDDAEAFDSFWETLDSLFNSILYVMLGISFVRILQMEHVILLSLVAIAANLIARAGSLSLSSLVMGRIPDGYDRLNFIKLLTWGGLRGGLSVALAMSTKEMLPENIYYIILGGTYAVVFFTTVIQGLTMKPVYNRINRSVAKRT
ncbi:cation:proton antiporter [Lachnoclostridium sp. MSJ-17]|uniref:cation:proton antiporter n=1 Tax=Lachnoclostridium sp. MSJ-17 TaxID=2841516 RepID=UPI001C1172C0|nr:sodium:proton antiporter [Lachnoclostridium sp. MSJ-17]MBU5462594.1 sodium:proton antiporter [Lachnoclostridium sp. MSJ-17]